MSDSQVHFSVSLGIITWAAEFCVLSGALDRVLAALYRQTKYIRENPDLT